MILLTRLRIMFFRNVFPVYILLVCLITAVLSRYPGHNGDMPFYIACAIEKDQGSMNGVIIQTMQVLQKELPAAEYQDQAAHIGNGDPVILRSDCLRNRKGSGIHEWGYHSDNAGASKRTSGGRISGSGCTHRKCRSCHSRKVPD